MRKSAFLIAVFAVFCLKAQTETPDSLKSEHQLDEVIVKGEKPQIKSDDGILTVDLHAIIKDKPVTNILESLGYLPGVMNNNGVIGLIGADDVTIIINGKASDIPLQNLYQLLYSMPVERLKSVEIMYAASAKYHVSGAVINVILNTPTPLDGLQGQARAGYGQAHYGSYEAGLAATYAVKDWTFDLNYGLSHTKSWNHEESRSNHLVNGSRHMIEDDMRRISRNLSNTIYASASWRKLSLTYNGQITSNVNNSNFSSGTFGSYLNSSSFPSPIEYHNLAARYETPFGMEIGGDYTRYYENRNQALYKDNEFILSALYRQSINRFHAYIDQTYRLRSWQLNYGVEYQRSDDKSSQHNYPYELAAFDNNLSEDIVDLYVETQGPFSSGLSLNASARFEYFHNNRRHNWNFVPQLGATYYKTPKSIFQFSFTSRRIYPSYWQLNGGTGYINEYSTVVGNPGLQPYLSYAVQFSYIFRQKYAATFYVNYDDKYSVQLPYQSPDELKLIFQTVNFDFSRTAGLNLHIPVEINRFITTNVTFNYFNRRVKASHFHDIDFDNRRWIFYGAINNTIRFSSSCPLSLSFDFGYISTSMQGIGSLSDMWNVDAGAKWQFGKNRCCELNLKASDIFNRWSPTLTINTAGQDYRMKVRDMTRSLRLTFIWRFNSFKPKEATIDTSRFGTGN